MDSGCLHGQRAVLKKAYFVHIAVSLRHYKAYGKHSYAFPGVSESVCQLYLCVCEYMNMNVCAQAHFVRQLQCVSDACAFVENIHVKQHVIRADNTTDNSVYCVEK